MPIITDKYDFRRNCRGRIAEPALLPVQQSYGLAIIHTQRSSGRYTFLHQEPDPRYFNFYNLSHLLSGRGWFWSAEEGRRDYAPGEAVAMVPDYLHDYNGYNSFEEDFICFTGPLADHLYQCGVIRPGILEIGKARRLLPIIELAADPSRNAQIKANLALQNLLVELYFENCQSSGRRHHSALEKLLEQVLKQPDRWWTTREMAEMLKLSVNQFIRLFSRHTGMTPKKYVDNCKIKQAAEMLAATDHPVVRIARHYGYRNQFHFSRRFREMTGLSPSEYRQKSQVR